MARELNPPVLEGDQLAAFQVKAYDAISFHVNNPAPISKTNVSQLRGALQDNFVRAESYRPNSPIATDAFVEEALKRVLTDSLYKQQYRPKHSRSNYSRVGVDDLFITQLLKTSQNVLALDGVANTFRARLFRLGLDNVEFLSPGAIAERGVWSLSSVIVIIRTFSSLNKNHGLDNKFPNLLYSILFYA